MIMWCAYCQSFLGQSEPFEDYTLSHGMCTGCSEDFEDFDPDAGSALRAFYDGLFSQVRQGQDIDARTFIEELDRLGVSRSHAYLGIVHPLLWRVGREFETGGLSVAMEHLFSSSMQSVLEMLGSNEATDSCDVLLVLAPGNEHTIGLEIMARLTQERTDLTAAVHVAPGSSRELAALLDAHRPRIFGVSAALPEHLPYLESVADWMGDLPSTQHPHLVVGGPGVVTGREAIPLGVTVCEPHHVPHGLSQLASLATTWPRNRPPSPLRGRP